MNLLGVDTRLGQITPWNYTGLLAIPSSKVSTHRDEMTLEVLYRIYKEHVLKMWYVFITKPVIVTSHGRKLKFVQEFTTDWLGRAHQLHAGKGACPTAVHANGKQIFCFITSKFTAYKFS